MFDIEPQKILGMGGGITFVVGRQGGRLPGATGRVEQPSAWAIAWEHGLAVHVIAGMGIDETRAAAERLAEKRR